MATRLGQISAEINTVQEWISLAPVSHTISTTKVHTGQYSVRMFGSPQHGIGLAFDHSVNALRSACFVNHVGVFSRARLFEIITPGQSTRPVSVLWRASTAQLELEIDGVLVASISDTEGDWNVQDTWHNLGIHVDAVHGRVSVYVNKNRVLNYSGEITGGWGILLFGSRTSVSLAPFNNFCYVDDFYVDELDNEGDEAPPYVRFYPKFSAGAGAANEFSPQGDPANWQNVDDDPSDDDTTHNLATTTDLEDLFAMTPAVVPDGYESVAVIPYALVRTLNSGAGNRLRLLVYDGLNYTASDELVPGPGYKLINHRFPLQPDGSLWTNADADAMQMGYRSGGSF